MCIFSNIGSSKLINYIRLFFKKLEVQQRDIISSAASHKKKSWSWEITLKMHQNGQPIETTKMS